MFTKHVKAFVVLAGTALLAACGSTPQPTVSLPESNQAMMDKKVGFVYIAPSDEATTHIYGADCLLCYGVASALTSKLDSHLEGSINKQELKSLESLVTSEYAQRDTTLSPLTLPVNISDLPKFKGELGFAKKDFRTLKSQLDVDVLVVLELDRHGAYRSFSGYIPNGDPQGHIAGTLYTVDLTSNAYLQYLALDEKVQPEGEWDEPPTFPNVTTSYYQALENLKEKIAKAI